MRILLLFLLLATSGHVSAALNKWVDSEGHVHYSDLPPPPSVKSTTLRGSTSQPPDAKQADTGASSTAPKSVAEREAELKKAQLDKKAADEKAAKDQAYAESLKASCAAARQNLQILQEGTRIMQLDANGEPTYLEDDQRQINIGKAQQDVANYCK